MSLLDLIPQIASRVVSLVKAVDGELSDLPGAEKRAAVVDRLEAGEQLVTRVAEATGQAVDEVKPVVEKAVGQVADAMKSDGLIGGQPADAEPAPTDEKLDPANTDNV